MQDQTLHSKEEDQLLQMKLRFVQCDYENYFKAGTRLEDRINQLHAWEVTLLAALMVLLKPDTQKLAYIGSFVIFGFFIIEALVRVSLEMLRKEALDTEARLRYSEVAAFKQAILTWTFGNTVVERRERPDHCHAVHCALRHPLLWVWHLILLIAVWVTKALS